MQTLIKTIIAITLLLNFIMLKAEEIEAKILCDAEIKKKQPDLDAIQKYCIQTAKAFEDSEQYQKAIIYYHHHIEIQEKILGKEHSNITAYYNNIGGLYQRLGDYPNALKYYKKAAHIYESKLGKKHSFTAISYSSIGGLYQRMGDYSKALSYFEKALKIQEKKLPDKDLQKAATYNNIGGLYQRIDDYLKALKYYKKAALIYENKLGKDHSFTAVSYHNIGGVYDIMEDYSQALKFYLKALQVNEKVLGKEHSGTATNYHNIGGYYQRLGQYPKALEYYKKANFIYEKIFGREHPYTITSYHTIGSFYEKTGEYPKAYSYAKKAFESFLVQRDRNFQILDTKQKRLYLKDNRNKIPLLFSIVHLYSKHNATEKQDKVVAGETLTNWLNYKGSIFDSENAIATLHANTKDPVLKEKIDNLIVNKRYLAKLYQSLPKPSERKQWQRNIKQTEEKIATLTSEISEKAEIFKEQQSLKDISYIDISKNLKEDELYIDYAKAGEYYYVFSLDNKEHITFTQIDENSTKEIDNLVKTFREDVTTILDDASITDEKLTELTAASKDKLSRLYEIALHKPLSKELLSKQNLILSPDGALRLLPFESMFDKINKKYLIEQKEIRYIPSGKELVRLYKYSNIKTTKPNTNQAVIISNPNFNAEDITKVASVDQEEIAITPNISRAGIIKSLFKMRFNPLPGTKAEAASIKDTLKAENLTEYKEEQASETNLMQVNAPKILHIATHGFFINDNTIPNPMLKSGIALSGANASAIRGKSDGIVTAMKLSGMKLKGTDLVVLSACQTGVVDINSTDSVSGLSKAFIQAGAKDIVMSLWSVDDKATKDLMSSFYQEMQKHPSYAKALKEAKLKMIEKGMHPFYWAPFVVSGS